MWRRTQRLAVRQDEIDARRYARMVAEREGINPDELWAETMAFKRECEHLGLRTEEERLEHTAREIGMPIDELRQEIERMQRDDADAGWRFPR